MDSTSLAASTALPLTSVDTNGDAENAGPENAGPNLQGWKRRDKCVWNAK